MLKLEQNGWCEEYKVILTGGYYTAVVWSRGDEWNSGGSGGGGGGVCGNYRDIMGVWVRRVVNAV